MRVVFHIISTGGGGGASRTTRYIAERDRDPTREGPGPRPLFSEDREDLTYRKADRILDPVDGQPQKDDLIHLSVSFQEEDFEKLGGDEKERQARLREVIREGMKGIAEELNAEPVTWIAGIHRNSDNPHAHIVMRKDVTDRATGKERHIGRISKSLLPHKQIEQGQEIIVPGRIGERFLAALDKQQVLYLNPEHEQTKAQIAWDQLVERIRKSTSERAKQTKAAGDERTVQKAQEERFAGSRDPEPQVDSWSIAAGWSEDELRRKSDNRDYRLALGEYLEFSTRLAFAEIWYRRAVKYGDTYRFNVIDQSTSGERKISDLDVHRRAAARAQRISSKDRNAREEAYETDLSRHRGTLDRLAVARERKIAALRKDIGSLRGSISMVELELARPPGTPAGGPLSPLLPRETLSELQETAVKLNLPEKVSELEALRTVLASEHRAPTRTDDEAAILGAQVDVARADFMARDTRLQNFDASLHLTNYEVHDERWSLGSLDKQIARRREDAKLIPERAARLDLRSLARLNYSAAEREAAASECEHLTFIRGEVVRQVEERRKPLVADRDLAREMVDILEASYTSEQRSRTRDGQLMPEPRYEGYQINSLEASAEILREPKLLLEVHEWEKGASKGDPEIKWEGRALAREIMSSLAVKETKERLQHFLESQRVASLHLGNHRTGTLREVEARTLTEYLARVIESREQRDHRHSITVAAREHRGRLVSDFQKARDYHDVARELASKAQGREPEFTDKERINLEIYAERQNDEAERERCVGLARSETHSQDREVSASRSR